METEGDNDTKRARARDPDCQPFPTGTLSVLT